MGLFLLVIWWITWLLQMFFAYGTAYRLTRDGGDNGMALFGWMILMNLAAVIPGLGIYLWVKNRDGNDSTPHSYSSRNKPKFMTEADNVNKPGSKPKSEWKNPYDPN